MDRIARDRIGFENEGHELSRRVIFILKRNGIKDKEELKNTDPERLKILRGCGEKTFTEVMEYIKTLN